MNAKNMLRLALALGGVGFVSLNIAEGQTHSSPQWTIFTETNRHFHFEYPTSWKINAEAIPFTHYRQVFVALNSMGEDHLTVRELKTSTSTWEFGTPEILKQLRAGAIYMDIGWWEGPGPLPRFGPGMHEMEGRELTALLKTAKEVEADGLIMRQIEFHKWGRSWSIMVYLRPPISEDQRPLIERVLASFRFDGVPVGDEIWALGVARTRLPPEADPDKFTREGGSSLYYTETKREGNDVVVTFTKSDGDKLRKTWRYRVTETGNVISMERDISSRVK
jgi:hypothetical protein